MPTALKAVARRLPKPYQCREAVFTCSNRWTIERCPPPDHVTEGQLLGNCLGGQMDKEPRRTHLSLREPYGTPHALITATFNADGTVRALERPHGHGNRWPKPAYINLINEYCDVLGQAAFAESPGPDYAFGIEEGNDWLDTPEAKRIADELHAMAKAGADYNAIRKRGIELGIERLGVN